MGRNNKDFRSCPECFGLGETYAGEDDREACPTCNPNDITTPAMERARENAAEDVWAKMEMQRDEE